MTTWQDAVWSTITAAGGGLLAVWGGFEARALWLHQPGGTFSEWMRPWAKKHPVVFVALCALVVAVGAWLPGHVLEWF